LVRLAVTLTAEPWALTPETVADVRGHGLDEPQIEAAVAVIAMFNYFTRVADATGIEFDYQTPLPAFQPSLRQIAAARPDRSGPPGGRPRHRRPLRQGQLQTAWESWRAYVLTAGEPISQRARRLLAAIAAEEAA